MRKFALICAAAMSLAGCEKSDNEKAADRVLDRMVAAADRLNDAANNGLNRSVPRDRNAFSDWVDRVLVEKDG